MHKPTEQNEKVRNKPMHKWLTNIWQVRQEYSMGKEQSSIHGVGKTE